jgi:hypothetical protein
VAVLVLHVNNMIGLIIVVSIAGIIVYISYKLKRAADKYKHIPGVSLIEFFKDAKNLPIRASCYEEKLSKIVTPVVTFVLATHPDSAKVKLDVIKFRN